MDASNQNTPAPLAVSDARVPWWFVAAVFVLVGLSYWPALHGALLWDDAAHVTRPALRSLPGLRQIWTEPDATQQYYPLLHSAFWLEHRLWGDATIGYHLVNIALHALSAVLFALLLRRLAVPGALIAGALFAVHPVHVESVAWISEQKNTLSLVFYLGAALAYLRFDRNRGRAAYRLALGCFVLALLTKSVTASLPAALLVLAWWRRGAISWSRDVVPLLPWFALSLTMGVLTPAMERAFVGADGATHALSLAERCLLAGRAVWFYAGKLLWPANLAFYYPRWTLSPADLPAWLPALLALALLGAAWLVRARSRALLAAALLFGGTLFPALGFFNLYPFRYSFVADHFQYHASLALIALGAAVVAWIVARARAAGAVLLAGLLAALAIHTWRHSHDFRDNTALFRATLVHNPDSWAAHNNLGRELLFDRAHWPEALAHFERAVALRPDYAEAQDNLGFALTKLGRAREAIPHHLASLRLKPDAFQTHNNLAISYWNAGEPERALTEFAAAVRLNPNHVNLHENWGKALLALGRRAEAEQRFTEAARLRGQLGASAP